MKKQFFSPRARPHAPSLKLADGARVAVVGGGPAGSFFSYFLLDLARRVDLRLQVDIYEARDFSLPAPRGCNMCAGVVSETLVQNLATEGINLPPSLVQKAINSYVLHTDLGTQRIEAAHLEKRIAALFRGAGPLGMQKITTHGLDGHLLSLAASKGARVIQSRVTAVDRSGDHLQVRTRIQGQDDPASAAPYDLLVVATGVNTAALKLFEETASAYKPPQTTKTALREYFLGKAVVDQYFGDTLHVFLLDLPHLDCAMIVPKGDFVSVAILGHAIDESAVQAFLTSPEVRSCFPPGWQWDQPSCQCMPRINVGAARRPYADRLVFIGDSGATRLYKDGIGAAYRSAKAAAATAILEGISASDFERFYAPFCNRLETDNQFGRFIFACANIIKKSRFLRRAMFWVVAAEQRGPSPARRMSAILWDTFTGSAPYLDVFLRALHPAFWSRLAAGLFHALAQFSSS